MAIGRAEGAERGSKSMIYTGSQFYLESDIRFLPMFAKSQQDLAPDYLCDSMGKPHSLC